VGENSWSLCGFLKIAFLRNIVKYNAFLVPWLSEVQLWWQHQSSMGAFPLQMHCPEGEASSLVRWNYTGCRTWLEWKSYRPGHTNTRLFGQLVHAQVLPWRTRRKVEAGERMRVADKKSYMAKAERSPPGYDNKQSVCSLMDMSGTGNNRWWCKATPSYLAGVKFQGVASLCLLHCEDGHSCGKRDDRRKGLAGPIRARLGPLQECSLPSSKEEWEIPHHHLCQKHESAYTRRCLHTA